MSSPPAFAGSTSYVRTTHDVTNQAPPLEGYDAFLADAPLREAVARDAAPWIADKLAAYGPVVGSLETAALAAQANRFVPELRTHDRYGHRIDEVEYHPAYHALMERAMQHEVHSAAWSGGAGGQLAHAALLYLHSQAEPGTCCPLTMTHAAVPSLRLLPELAAEWVPRMLQTQYDPRCMPARAKRSATLGMAMTEKQGGSDVRSNSTRAVPLGASGPGRAYALTGHKWFCSAPMSDAFLALAQTERGLSCFFVPRFWHDGSRNRCLIQRLKDKLGNRSNASSEIEYDQCRAVLIGEEGRGVAAIMPMVAHTRVDCASGSAGLLRQATLLAIHHARHRSAFGRALVHQPLMQNVLADLALEAEAALALSLRAARSLDAAQRDGATAQDLAFSRVATALAKYWVTRRAPRAIGEAMECLGGAGYVEESGLPRLYREAPVNSIWEGSGNVQCLDLLRSVARKPDSLGALVTELELARGGHRALAARLDRIAESVPLMAAASEQQARRFAEDLALALSASQLVRHAPQVVADAYCESRLGPDRALEYGALPPGLDCAALIERALPQDG